MAPTELPSRGGKCEQPHLPGKLRRRGKVEEIRDGMLKSGKNERRNAEEDGDNLAPVAPDSHGKVHKDAAQCRPQERLRKT